MAENHVTIVFDRKKKAEETGTGKIELQIRLTQTCRKYITVDECTPKEWRTRKFSENVIAEQNRIEKIVSAMECLEEDMTMENLNKHLGLQTIKREPRKKPIIKVKQEKNPLKESFLDFMRDEIIKEHSKDSTKRQKMVALDALERWGNTLATVPTLPTKTMLHRALP